MIRNNIVQDVPAGRRWRRMLLLSGLGVAILLHVALVLREFPPSVLLKGDPPVKGDVGRYFASAAGAARVSGLYGYDPHFMAGYPVGLWNSMGKKGFEVFHLLLPMIPLPSLFYLVIVGLSLACPLLVWLALRRLCPTKRSSWILFALCLVYWHLGTQVSYFWGFGNIFFPAASCLLVLAVSLADGIVGGRRPLLNTILLGLCMTAIFYFHTVVLLAALVPLLAVLLLGRSRWRPELWPAMGFSVIIFLALALPWLVALLQNRQDCLAQPKAWFQGGPKHLIMDVFSDRAYRHHFDRNFLYHVAVVLGASGTWLCLRQKANTVFAALGLGGIAALGITYGVTYIRPLASIQPYRFMIPATLLLLGPAAISIDRGIDVFLRADKACKTTIALLLLILAPQFTAYVIDLGWSAEPCGVTEGRRQVIDELGRLQVKGRIICDDSGLGHIVPYYCDLPVIGGISAQAFLKHRFAGIDDEGILFGKKAGAWGSRELMRYLDTYAVEYAVFTTQDWVRFARKPDSPFAFVKTVGGQHLFKVHNFIPSFVLKGKAVAAADYDSITVLEVASRELVLKFHYAKWLQADNNVRLSPARTLEDPVPFIRASIPANVTAFTISKQ